jgi:hypothetical protein
MTTLSNVHQQVMEMSKNCFDDFISVKDISFEHLESIKIGSEKYPLLPMAQMSMAFRLGIPMQYLKKCPPDVQAYNMNHWIKHEKNDELFFRFDGQDVRAIFTPRYQPIDNVEILERLDSLGYKPDTEVQCHLDKEFMLLNLPDSKKMFRINKDKHVPGVSISNSEVGLASVNVAAYLLRLICTNGMVGTTEVAASYKHVSRKILDMLPEVISSLNQDMTVQQNLLRHSLDSTVDNPIMTIENFNRQFQLKEAERQAVEWAWPMEEGKTMFNVVQAYTRAAQFDGLSAEASYRLQKVGGNILAMLN